MTRMNRLRNRLILVFVMATALPLALAIVISSRLLERSFDLSPLAELDEVSQSLERVGREFYQQARESLRRDVAAGKVAPRIVPAAEATEFRESNELERFVLTGEHGNTLAYFVRRGKDVLIYERALGSVGMHDLTQQYARARELVESSRSRNLRRGFNATLLTLIAAMWVGSMLVLVYWAHRISRPVNELTRGLAAVAEGDLSTRLEVKRDDEIGAAMAAFNHMADQIQEARERLITVTRLASWQALARKMAHEVKNSLTPIRLTMEEILSRRGENDGAFLEQAAQIVADEVNTLERRVRAFSEFAAEPPVLPAEIDVNALVEERVSFLKSAHPEVIYNTDLAPERPKAVADPDLIKGVLTNLLENAAEAARAGGVVLAKTALDRGKLAIEVHDSGPGLSLQARSSLFEPTISFKKGGMGLGLSIARRSAILCGGDILPVDGELGGAAFRVTLAAATNGSE
jgi:nitrogen fixation/metabolism regulation signal transduction histidine kinase